jgi:predicted RNase H-like HicB family nuclease
MAPHLRHFRRDATKAAIHQAQSALEWHVDLAAEKRLHLPAMQSRHYPVLFGA